MIIQKPVVILLVKNQVYCLKLKKQLEGYTANIKVVLAFSASDVLSYLKEYKDSVYVLITDMFIIYGEEAAAMLPKKKCIHKYHSAMNFIKSLDLMFDWGLQTVFSLGVLIPRKEKTKERLKIIDFVTTPDNFIYYSDTPTEVIVDDILWVVDSDISLLYKDLHENRPYDA